LFVVALARERGSFAGFTSEYGFAAAMVAGCLSITYSDFHLERLTKCKMHLIDVVSAADA
jgi:hypothetical protein